MLTLDVSPGEFAAVSDYNNQIAFRQPANFIIRGDCLFCGQVANETPLHHLHSNQHRMHAAQYRTCAQSLLLHEHHALESREGCASRREIVLVYLGARLARTDMIVDSLHDYNRVAVAYLLHRASVSELLRVFSRVEGREYESTRGLCSICLERPATVVFQSCGHLCVCRLCAAKLKTAQEEKEDSDDECVDTAQCPICRTVSQTRTVFVV